LTRAQGWRERRRGLLTTRRKAALHRGKVRATLGQDQLPRLPQRRLGRDESGAGVQRLLDQPGERWGLEERPPLVGEAPSIDEALRLAACHGRRGRCGRQRRPRIARDPRRTGATQTRPTRTAEEERHHQEKDYAAAHAGRPPRIARNQAASGDAYLVKVVRLEAEPPHAASIKIEFQRNSEGFLKVSSELV